jgi:hypothetical protein
MKWIYRIQQKLPIAFLLAIILAGVFIKNMVERNNVSDLGDSFASVYEDRLLVESYIYQLSDRLYKKKLIVGHCGESKNPEEVHTELKAHNAAIHILVTNYEKTKLTEAEVVSFQSLKSTLSEIEIIEAEFLKPNTEILSQASFEREFRKASGNLNQLSNIQLAEGKILADQSKKIVAGSSILTQFELGMIIIIGLIIQALVLASNSITAKTDQKHQLN